MIMSKRKKTRQINFLKNLNNEKQRSCDPNSGADQNEQNTQTENGPNSMS